MRILIDADGCPVVDISVELARKYGLECIILCDTSHIFEKEGARTITISKGPDSVDFALVNLMKKGDIVVTQDYGLAAMCLAMGGLPVSQNGLEYTNENIDSLLEQRYISGKIRRAGGRQRGPLKRTGKDDKDFQKTLEEIVEGIEKNVSKN